VQYAFRERLGVGPNEYFRMLWLNAVCGELKRATDDGQGIRQIATRFGFSHFGNFAADYRWQFGELPSATRQPPSLRRPGRNEPGVGPAEAETV
jgi:AraC family ethanolamine operon transcriptional activator